MNGEKDEGGAGTGGEFNAEAQRRGDAEEIGKGAAGEAWEKDEGRRMKDEGAGTGGDGKGERYDEKKVAGILGVRRRFVTRWREMMGERGRDWGTQGGQAALTLAGAQACAKALARAVSKRKLAGAVVEGEGRVTCTVYRIPTNRKMVLCSRADNLRFPEAVGVRDASLFRIGDTFEAEPDGNGGLAFYGRWPEAGW